MGRKPNSSTVQEEAKVEAQALAQAIIAAMDQLEKLAADSLSADYADDSPRNQVLKGLDELHRGLYGEIPERAHAELVYLISVLNDQADADHANDGQKQKERSLCQVVRRKAYALIDQVRQL